MTCQDCSPTLCCAIPRCPYCTVRAQPGPATPVHAQFALVAGSKSLERPEEGYGNVTAVTGFSPHPQHCCPAGRQVRELQKTSAPDLFQTPSQWAVNAFINRTHSAINYTGFRRKMWKACCKYNHLKLSCSVTNHTQMMLELVLSVFKSEPTVR